MVPTSPPSTSTGNASRPPARNRSSSALSTQTLKSQSSASTGKPRRNKSSASLAGQHHTAHGHGAGHHTISFQHHRKASHGPHGLKRVGSASGSSRKPTFGLGMTSMGDSEAVETGQHEGTASLVQQPRRPSMSKRRTSSSSTVTAVSRPSHERRTSGAGGRRSRSNSTAALLTEAEPAREAGDRDGQAKSGQTEGSVSSSSGDWESATDSPIRFAQKLPDTSEENPPPEDQSALTKALDAHEDPADAQASKPQQQQVPARGPGRKAKFQLGASDPFEDEDDEDDEEDGDAPPRDQKVAHQAGTEPAIPPETQAGQVDGQGLDDDVVPEAEEGSIPAAAMPPAATAAVPSLPATIRAVAPPTPEGGLAELDPNDEQEAAGVAAPPPTSAPQHLSPPEIPPDDQVDRSKSGASLLAAAQPELAFPNKPPSNPPSQGPTRATSPYPDPATPPAGPTKPLSPNPTSVQRDREEREGEQSPPKKSKQREPEQQQRGDKPSSSPSKASMPPRLKPVRKASDASIISTMSRRSYFDRPAPQFRRSASGVAPPSVDRDVTARGNFSAAINEESHTSEERRGHARGESMNSMRSLRQATEPATAPQARRANSLAPGDAQRPRSSENAGGALAALGSIAAAAGRPSPSPVEPALSHAKRSASGYFNALRGFTSIPAPSSTPPPLSPSTSQSPRYPIPGPSSSSYTRSSSTRPRPSPSPRQPPLVVKFVEPPQPSGAVPPERPASVQRASSPAALRGNLSAQHRNASSASLGPMSRTQQKALLARDAPQYAGGEAAGGALVPPATPGGLTPAQQQFLALQQQRAAATAAAAASGPATGAGGAGNSSSGSGPPSSTASPAPGAQAVNQGMQKWAFGLVREAERIERQYRAVEKWRDPLGESLERVLIVRQRARRRREDDREKVKQAIAAAAAAKQQQQLQPGGASKSRMSTPEAGMSRRSSAGGTSEGDSRPASTQGKQRGVVA